MKRSHCFYILGLIVCLAMSAILSGCATVAPIKRSDLSSSITDQQPTQPPDGIGWWQAHFRIKFDEGTEPLWHVDLLLAHGVIAPVLKEFEDDIDLWRFHRRAVHDQGGHQFSLLIFSSPETADNVFNAIKASPLLQKMKYAGIVENEIYDDTSEIRKPDIEDTSDANWSLTTQKTWPYYIMGVSRMWLAMIEEMVRQNPMPDNFTSTDQLEDYYRGISESINKIWHEEGNHAFLHHLRALFGYEPVVIYEQRVLRF